MILEAFVVVGAISLVGLFGVRLARWVETLKPEPQAQSTEHDPANAGGNGGPGGVAHISYTERLHPLALKSWRVFKSRVSGGEIEITLGSGDVYREDGIDWFEWPGGAEVEWHSDLRLSLARYRDSIKRNVPSVMRLESK